MLSAELQQQYDAVKKRAAWAQLTSEDILQATGPEAVSFLNSYNTQDLQGMRNDQIKLGAFLTQKGKIVSDARLLKLPERVLVLLSSGYAPRVLKHLEIFLNFAEAEMISVSENWSHFALLGPQAKAQLESLLRPWNIDLGPAPAEGSVRRFKIEGDEVLLFPSTDLGAPALELLVPRSLETVFLTALQKSKLPQLSPCVLEILRIEKGLPKIGVDMGEDHLVAEVGLDKRATSFNKGCYLGQETTARVDSRGHVNRRLTLLQLEKPLEGQPPFPVYLGDQQVGLLTSRTDSPRFQAPIGLGVVQAKALGSEKKLRVGGPQEGPTLKVIPL